MSKAPEVKRGGETMTRLEAAEEILQIFVNEQRYMAGRQEKKTAVAMAIAALLNETESEIKAHWEDVL